MSNRRCPRCQATYSAPARFCVRDGSPLVEVAPAPVAAPAPAPAAAGSASAPTAPPAGPPAALGSDAAQADDDASIRQRLATLTNQMLDHRYRVGARLGEGGMSYVYLARDLTTDETVAVKILIPRLSRDPDSVERLRREAAIAERFTHPNVCPILRFGRTPDGLVYLVMPYLPGEPLNEHETRRGPFPVDEAVPLLIQACEGLQHAHEHGIVHRDLKPENVMLVPDGEERTGFRAVVMDFGLAKQRKADPELVKLTQTGIVLGTPEFMSPEQIRGKPLDGRSDVYALGVLAFELLTGQLPFAGKTAQDMMLARLRTRPASLRGIRPELPARLDQVIQRALATEPDDRWQSMTEFARGLAGVTQPGLFARLFGR